MMQIRTTDTPVLVLTGLSQRGLTEWVFVPKDWDVEAVLRQFRFSGTARSRTRQCLATPSSVKALIVQYGEASMVPAALNATLTELLDKALIAVDLKIIAPGPADEAERAAAGEER
ncbi:hypothetical protein [Pigmentiphaga litoralis]|uniref:Uncharacterized protein n=1 Tax=Pigmentiphaga litoralis TaxID=516702 RepID=A0A7Y9LNT5_9BURK|nr:hypothetical protein [Pigmentiphaga litoralis]NYE22822.1 hypothetical protein [Pigmentiphaga litoralis]NYE83563.1 hypothetical protein [Pigmentiphaga litoralis]